MRANILMKQNILHLLRQRGLSQKGLAMYCYRKESWISKILNEEHRDFPMKYYDKIADYLGVSTYQLFQPGLSSLTERRTGIDRRSVKDRRIAPGQRAMLRTAYEINTHRPTRERTSSHVVVAASSPLVEALSRASAEHAKKVDAIISRFSDAGGQAPSSRTKVAAARPRRRAAGRSSDSTD